MRAPLILSGVDEGALDLDGELLDEGVFEGDDGEVLEEGVFKALGEVSLPAEYKTWATCSKGWHVSSTYFDRSSLQMQAIQRRFEY